MLGLCGGYQMLGRTIADPAGIEGPPGAVDGLGLLDVETVLSGDKRLEPVRGETGDGAPFAGYEMHMGVTTGPDCARPFARLADGSSEGAVSADGRVIGTYIHGLFADDRQRSAWLDTARAPDRPRLPMMRSSKTRLIASRRTSRRMSISTGCSAYRDDDAAPRATSPISIASARR